jgi:hypothetical protein
MLTSESHVIPFLVSRYSWWNQMTTVVNQSFCILWQLFPPLSSTAICCRTIHVPEAIKHLLRIDVRWIHFAYSRKDHVFLPHNIGPEIPEYLLHNRESKPAFVSHLTFEKSLFPVAKSWLVNVINRDAIRASGAPVCALIQIWRSILATSKFINTTKHSPCWETDRKSPFSEPIGNRKWISVFVRVHQKALP